MVNYEQNKKFERLADLRTIINKALEKYEEIILSEMLSQLFEKKGYTPKASMRYLKELSLIMKFEIDTEKDVIRKL